MCKIATEHVPILCADVLEADFRKPFVNVNRYLLTLFNQSEFKAVLGEVTFCTKAIEPAAAPAKENKKKEKKEKKEQVNLMALFSNADSLDDVHL